MFVEAVPTIFGVNLGVFNVVMSSIFRDKFVSASAREIHVEGDLSEVH